MGPHKQDAKLMQLVAAGDRQAQEAALCRLRRSVHVISSSILGHAQDAEDATQASLIQILRRAGTFRGDSRLETWARRIGAREALRLAEERRLRAARTVPEGAVPEEPAAVPVELSIEVPRRIREYLNDLPANLRSALVLRHVLGYTVPEIAELTHTSPNTIKDRLARARAQVRRMVGRDLLATQPQRVNQS